MSVFHTHAHGKLLLTGEYFVLDGALALALPVRYGQSLRVESGIQSDTLTWTSRDHAGNTWFEAVYALPDLQLLSATDGGVARTLAQILHACRQQNPAFLATSSAGVQVFTQNDFPREWGLGTSSTLIAAVAKWAGVDPYPVLFNTLGGSGYDLACAYADGPLTYRLLAQKPAIQPIKFAPSFSAYLKIQNTGKQKN